MNRRTEIREITMWALAGAACATIWACADLCLPKTPYRYNAGDLCAGRGPGRDRWRCFQSASRLLSSS